MVFWKAVFIERNHYILSDQQIQLEKNRELLQERSVSSVFESLLQQQIGWKTPKYCYSLQTRLAFALKKVNDLPQANDLRILLPATPQNNSNWKWGLSELPGSRGENEFTAIWIQVMSHNCCEHFISIRFPKLMSDSVVWLLSQGAFWKKPERTWNSVLCASPDAGLWGSRNENRDNISFLSFTCTGICLLSRGMRGILFFRVFAVFP